MASTGEIVLNSFLGIAGDQWTGVGVSELLRSLIAAAEESAVKAETSSGSSGGLLGQVMSNVLGGSALNAAAAASSSGSTGGSTLGRVVSAVFGSALGMAPLAKAIIGLFTGGGKEPEQALSLTYDLSARINA